MTSNKTLLKAIERCDKRIARASNKKKYSRNRVDIEAAENMIKAQESKRLILQQQMILNNERRS